MVIVFYVGSIFVFNYESRTALDQLMLSYLQRSDEIYTCLKVYLFLFTPICLQHTLAIMKWKLLILLVNPIA